MATKGTVFDIRHGVTGHGPGERTVVLLKGCPLPPRWCPLPETVSEDVEVAHSADRCDECGDCVVVCPEEALTLDDGVLRRDAQRCTVCEACTAVCPTDAHELVGRAVSVQQVVRAALDHRASGVTLAGGEPTVQDRFVAACLRALREDKVHLALQTFGLFKPSMLDELLPLVDLWLFHLIPAGPDTHQRLVGVDNHRILANLARVVADRGPEAVLPKLPLVPGITTAPDSLRAVAVALTERGYRGPVELLAPGPADPARWTRLGHPAPDNAPLDDATLKAARQILAQAGLTPGVCR